MPSASVKQIEKTQPCEASDPIKQCLSIIEKKMRNLEKRKMKLDNYRSDVENGKELNEDQKIAVSKYDTVLSQIDFAKELIKAVNTLHLETSRQLKKQAKKEQLERQQHEIQRLQLAFFYRHILSCFQNEDVRSDFLNGENGAVQLSSEQLSHLDQLNKLFGPGLPNDLADLENHFHTLAENHIFLVESRNKEVAGTTYKTLKDLLQSIKDCGYFSRSSEAVDDDTSSEDLHEEETVKTDNSQTVADMAEPAHSSSDEQYELEDPVQPLCEELPSHQASNLQNGPLQEVLSQESTFNFLQESQIDLDAPHMDPAVVAVHQMPPPAVNFAVDPYPASPTDVDSSRPLTNGTEPHEQSPPVPVVPAAMPHSIASVQLDFDPSHPIPTQTFTNQSFAVMQNMMMSPAYVPVTVHHGPLPPHLPIAVVPAPPVTSPTMPVHVPVAISDRTVLPANGAHQEDDEADSEDVMLNREICPGGDPTLNDVSTEKTHDGNGYQYRGGYRGRGRGRGNNGYFRGRSNFYNGRGNYQNRYYQDRNGYNGYRRDNNRGPRGGGNNRGRGSYNRPHPQSSQQSQIEQQ